MTNPTIKRAVLGAILAAGISGYGLQAASKSYTVTKWRCSTATTENGNCLTNILRMDANEKPFNFVLWNRSGYTVDTVWVRARLPGESSWTQLDKYGNDINGDPTAATYRIFWFNPGFLEEKLNTTLQALQDSGFEFELKIRSVGAGSGRQDQCSTAKVEYVGGSDPYWKWQHKGKSSWYRIGANDSFKYKPSGTVNDVKCVIKGIDGSKL